MKNLNKKLYLRTGWPKVPLTMAFSRSWQQERAYLETGMPPIAERRLFSIQPDSYPLCCLILFLVEKFNEPGESEKGPVQSDCSEEKRG